MNELKLSPELLVKAQACNTIDDLKVLVQENGISATDEQLSSAFAGLNKSEELSDSELDDVCGGYDAGDNDCCRNKANLVFLDQVRQYHRYRCNICGKIIFRNI